MKHYDMAVIRYEIQLKIAEHKITTVADAIETAMYVTLGHVRKVANTKPHRAT